jgi:hypothetical protein
MKTRFIALAVAATMGLGSVSAFAQDHHRDGGGQAAWQHQRADQGRGDWAHNNRYAAPRYYGPSQSYRRDNGDVVGAVVLGAIAGALIGQAGNGYNYNAPPATYYNQAPAYYNQAPAYYTPAPAYYNPGYGYYGN